MTPAAAGLGGLAAGGAKGSPESSGHTSGICGATGVESIALLALACSLRRGSRAGPPA